MDLPFLAQTYFSLLLSIILIYFIGQAILSMIDLRLDRFTNLFFSLVCGIYVSVTLYSIVLSKGITFNLPPFLVLLGLICYYRRKFEFNFYFKRFKMINYSDFIIISLVSFFYFLIQTSYNFNIFTGEIKQISGDQLYYSFVGNFLSQFGKENRFINIENTKYLKLIPYHYGDSWLIAFFHSIFKFPAPYIYNYIVNPLLIFVYYIGCLAFIEKGLGQVKKIHIILIPLVVFFTSISMPIFDFLPGRLYQWSLINLPKQGINFIGFQFFFILLFQNKIKIALMLTPIYFSLYLVSLPVILSSCFFLTLFYFSKNVISIKETLSILTLYFFFATSIIAFYFVFGAKDSGTAQSLSYLQIVGLNPLSYFKTFFNCFVGSLSLTIIGLSIYFFFLFFKTTLLSIVKNIDLVFPFCVFYFSSLFFYCLFNYHPDGAQFWYNVFFPILGSFFCFFIVLIFRKTKFSVLIFLFFTIINLFYNYSFNFEKIYSKQEIKNLNKQQSIFYGKAAYYIRKEKQPKFAFIKSFKSVDYFEKNPYNGIFSGLSNINQSYFPVCLSVFEIPSSENIVRKGFEYNILKNTPFYSFVISQKNNNEFKSLEESQYAYLKKFKITFLEIEKNTKIPENIIHLVDTIIVNEYSKDKFVVLKNHMFKE